MTITDQDLFPAGSVTLNGMKIYSDRSVSQIIGFASAVVQTAGSGLVPLFDEMMHSQNGRHYRVDTFRRYEGGGLGAEIQGDVILMGSIGFMKLMKVRMPGGHAAEAGRIPVRQRRSRGSLRAELRARRRHPQRAERRGACFRPAAAAGDTRFHDHAAVPEAPL